MNTPPSPLRRSGEVLETLRILLESPDYPPGTKLTPERELALMLNTSRRALREALYVLESEGKIERVPGRGTIVLDPENKEFLIQNVLHHTSPLEILDARYMLEPALAAAAAVHASPYDLARIQQYFDKTLDAATHSEWEKWDALFHNSLGAASNNPILKHFYDVLTHARTSTEWGKLRKKTLTEKKRLHYIHQHQEIIDAIKSRNAEQAALAMRLHLTSVRNSLLKVLLRN